MFEHSFEEPHTTCSKCGAVIAVSVYERNETTMPFYVHVRTEQIAHTRSDCRRIFKLRHEEFPHALA